MKIRITLVLLFFTFTVSAYAETNRELRYKMIRIAMCIKNSTCKNISYTINNSENKDERIVFFDKNYQYSIFWSGGFDHNKDFIAFWCTPQNNYSPQATMFFVDMGLDGLVDYGRYGPQNNTNTQEEMLYQSNFDGDTEINPQNREHWQPLLEQAIQSAHSLFF